MRPLEILFALATGVCLLLSSLPVLARSPWPSRTALVAVAAATAQALLEGPRWQLLPMEVLSAGLLAGRFSAAGVALRCGREEPSFGISSP